MDFEQRAGAMMRGAMELAPGLRQNTQAKQLRESLKLYNFHSKSPKLGEHSKLREHVGKFERYFLADTFATTLDRSKSLWLRNASWALFFVARALELSTKKLPRQAEKQLGYAEEELQLGASAKAMVFARMATRKSKQPKAKKRSRRR